MGADRIIVMRQGAIVEEGTHLELMQLKGYYQEMYLYTQGITNEKVNI